MQSNVIGIIPARFASTRFPGKPLVTIHGKSMIQRVYEQALQVSLFSKIIVATDDMKILEHVENFGGNVLMTSPHHQSGTDRCGEVMQTIFDTFDIAVNIQGDEPFIQPEQLLKLIESFADENVEIATLIKKITDEDQIANPNVVKVVSNINNHAMYFSRNAIPSNKNKNESITYFKHIGIYAYRTEILDQIIHIPPSSLEKAESLEQLRWLENGFKITVVETDIETFGIDTPEDLNAISAMNIIP